MDDDFFFQFAIVMTIFLIAVGYFMHGCGKDSGEDKLRAEAVVDGHAYYTNNEDGTSCWKWKLNQIVTTVTNTITVTNATNTINITNVITQLEKQEGQK